MKKTLTIMMIALCGIATSAPVCSMMAARSTVAAASDQKQYTAADYIQDGLVAMWDGIENAGWVP